MNQMSDQLAIMKPDQLIHIEPIDPIEQGRPVRYYGTFANGLQAKFVTAVQDSSWWVKLAFSPTNGAYLDLDGCFHETLQDEELSLRVQRLLSLSCQTPKMTMDAFSVLAGTPSNTQCIIWDKFGIKSEVIGSRRWWRGHRHKEVLVRNLIIHGARPIAFKVPEKYLEMVRAVIFPEGTDLEGTSLEGTDLEGTSLEGTSLEGTSLEGTSHDL